LNPTTGPGPRSSPSHRGGPTGTRQVQRRGGWQAVQSDQACAKFRRFRGRRRIVFAAAAAARPGTASPRATTGTVTTTPAARRPGIPRHESPPRLPRAASASAAVRVFKLGASLRMGRGQRPAPTPAPVTVGPGPTVTGPRATGGPGGRFLAASCAATAAARSGRGGGRRRCRISKTGFDYLMII
jgi:hypothetical protein